MIRESIQDKIVTAYLAGKKVDVSLALKYSRKAKRYILPEAMFKKALQKKLDTNDLSIIAIPMRMAKNIWRYLLRNGFYFEVVGDRVEVHIDQYKLSTITAVLAVNNLLMIPTKPYLIDRAFFSFDGVSEIVTIINRIFNTLYSIDKKYMRKRFNNKDSIKCLYTNSYNSMYCYIDGIVDIKTSNLDISEKINKRLNEIDRKERERQEIIEERKRNLTSIQDEINKKKEEDKLKKRIKDSIIRNLDEGLYIYDVEKCGDMDAAKPVNIHEWAAVLYTKDLLENPKIYRRKKYTIKACATNKFRERYEGSPRLSTWIVEKLLRIINRYFPDIIPVSPKIRIIDVSKRNYVTLEFYWEPYYG